MTIRRQRARAAAALALLTTALATPTTSAAPDPAAQYLGVWNYDQPDQPSMTNIATMNLAGRTVPIPQIGTMRWWRTADGGVVGRSDQGCTWHFKVTGDALDLTSTDQYCFNKVIGSGYNIDRWHVTVAGDAEQESLHANSYLPIGTFSFELRNGKRTKADIATRAETVQSFAGTWTVDPPNPATSTNLTTTVYLNQLPVPSPTAGSVTMAPGAGDTLIGRTEDGCSWTFEAHGNTAELASAPQSCARPDGTLTRTFWSMASDGRNQTTIMSGIDPRGNGFLVSHGTMTKVPQR